MQVKANERLEVTQGRHKGTRPRILWVRHSFDPLFLTHPNDSGILLAPFHKLLKSQLRVLVPVHISENLLHTLENEIVSCCFTSSNAVRMDTMTQRQIQVGKIWPGNVLSLGCLHRAVTWPSLRSFYRLIVQSAASRRRWSCRLCWYRTAGMPLEGIQNNKIRSNVSSAGKTYT